jgi:hypothetical protein
MSARHLAEIRDQVEELVVDYRPYWTVEKLQRVVVESLVRCGWVHLRPQPFTCHWRRPNGQPYRLWAVRDIHRVYHDTISFCASGARDKFVRRYVTEYKWFRSWPQARRDGARVAEVEIRLADGGARKGGI